MSDVKLVDFGGVDAERFERWDIVGHQINRHVADADLTGTPAVVADVIEFPPGFVHRMHRHFHADQFMLPISGSVRFYGHPQNSFDVGAGQLLILPRQCWHEVRNESDEVCRVFHFFSGVGAVGEIGYESFEKGVESS